ncbi:MAG: choice-of-anchor J domain-containing protein, partial [Bacteroidales bacterium]|nr:choice-of-anchor J domain-containing protein [Bacteroidales bacterium]
VEHLPATELTASIYDYTTIRLSWTASASPYLNGYNVYRDGVLYATTSTTSYDDFEQSYYTEYCYYVTALCGDGAESAATNTVCIKTEESPCNDGPIGVPYYEGFEGGFPTRCWTLRYADDDNSINGMNHSTLYSYEGQQSFKFSSFDQTSDYEEYLITPEIGYEGAMKVSFYYRSHELSSTESFKVGYSLTGNEIADFTWSETVSSTNVSWQLYEHYVPAGTKYVSIQYCSRFKFYLYVDAFTLEATTLPEYTINATAEPTIGATVSGGGIYSLYDTATITAVISEGYTFNGWTENGNLYTTDLNFSINVSEDRSFVAYTDINHYRVYLNAMPTNGGSVSGYGRYEYGALVTINAIPADGYVFESWVHAGDGSVFATEASYSFNISYTVNLIAKFHVANVYSYWEDTTCEGVPYIGNGFNIPEPLVGTNTYQQTIHVGVYDSTAFLQLTVNPTY